MSTLRSSYDFILFDCPPRLSVVSFAALCASDYVVIPLEAADWGAQGIVQVTAAIEEVQRHYNPRLKLLGYLVSRFKRARAYQQSYLKQLRSHFGGLAFDTVIPDLARFEQSVTDRIPITLQRLAPKRPMLRGALPRSRSPHQSARLAKAVTAANRTFAARPASLLEQKPQAGAEALDGRRRLAGAYFIEIGRIHPDPTQPRRQLDSQAQQELTLSIKQFGIMQPIAVRYIESQKIYQIISGERRYQAALRAKLTEIPCWVQTPREEEILVRQIVENWQRSDLSPFELADALASIRDANKLTQDALAKLTGKPKGEISKLLALLSLVPEVQKRAGRIRHFRADNSTRFPRSLQIAKSNSSRKSNDGD